LEQVGHFSIDINYAFLYASIIAFCRALITLFTFKRPPRLACKSILTVNTESPFGPGDYTADKTDAKDPMGVASSTSERS
jgi:hypothetical protein